MDGQSPKRILFFGDSLTWGWRPTEEDLLVERYPPEQRWTQIVARALGADFEIIEEGLSGRMTAFDDPVDPRLNASDYLPSALASHLPLDLIVLMLGTNDTKAFLQKSALDISLGMAKLLVQVAQSAGGVSTIYPAPRTLLVAPPKTEIMPNSWIQLVFEGSAEKLTALAKHYEALANYVQIDFMNAGDHVTVNGIDGVHFSVENNAEFATAMTAKIRSIFD